VVRRSSKGPLGLASLVIGLALVLTAAPAFAEHDKSDVVTTDDGSTLVGEIKSVQFATLNLNTDPAGLLSIEWRHVTGMTSKFEYRVEVNGGVRHFGTLGQGVKPGTLSIITASQTTVVDLMEVVEVIPVEHGFWKRLDGSVNFGLTYTGTNSALQYNLSGNAYYRTRRTYASFTAQSIFNTQDGVRTTDQWKLDLLVSQIGPGQWGAFELGALQSNRDLGYDLRVIAGGGATKFLIEDSRATLGLFLGVVYNREQVAGNSDVDESGEALIGAAFRLFKRGSHSPSIQISLATFTNLTGASRFRAAFSLNLGWKIIGNFILNFDVSESYDTDPPGTGVNNNLTIVTSVGFTF
jgi:hypothetical protein